MTDSFGAMLNEYRVAVGLSQNALALRAGIDAAYINRIERGLWPAGSTRAHAPSRAVVLQLASALVMDDRDTDRLLFLAGLAPQRDYQALYEAHERTITRIGLLVDGMNTTPPGNAASVTSPSHTTGEALVLSAEAADPDLSFVRRSA